jgi:putative effector of murein hydrolase LrgA (UPF0299 family)
MLNLLFLMTLVALFFVPNGILIVIDGSVYVIDILIVSYLGTVLSIDFLKSAKKAIERRQTKRRSQVQKPKKHHRKLK